MSSKKKKNDAVTIDRDESSDDESSDDEDNARSSKKSQKKKSPMRCFSLSHTCKLSFLTFVMFVLIMSDVFVERVMGKANLGLIQGRIPTKKGICAQGVILVIALIVLDFLISHEKI
jgi:uncharacterized protein YqhQ